MSVEVTLSVLIVTGFSKKEDFKLAKTTNINVSTFYRDWSDRSLEQSPMKEPVKC